MRLTYIGHLYIIYIDDRYIKGDEFMAIDKSLLTGSTTMLLLKLLDDKDMYGYQMIEELSKRSDDTFSLKAGTLYPLLHNLEEQGMLNSYDENPDSARVRKYYSITKKGKGLLADKKAEWKTYSSAVNQVLQGGANIATV
ncbi:MAG: PadR family transcriptional regulator [Clostridiales bacterium]|nr:PadR family transcriptional regulator [Clostridiales bacterium]